MAAPAAEPDLPILQLDDEAAWERWLEERHAVAPGVWLKIAKAGCQVATVTYPQALQVALCFGWIDGRKRGFDDAFWLQRFTPRRPRSRWSQVNRAHAERLLAAGRMRPAGVAEVERARADGRWDAAYEPQAGATVPDDLRRALDADPGAAAFFATLTGARRYAFLHRLHHVTTPQGRARRIASYIELLREGRTLG